MTDDMEAHGSVTPAPRQSRRVLWIAVSVGLAVALIVGVLAGAQLGEPTFKSPLVGKPAPSFDLASLDGDGRVRNGDYRGQYYVLNLWASWCVPCREEAPVLQSFHERWSSRGVALVGIVYNDTESAARKFRDRFGLTYPQVVDPKADAGIVFGVHGIPETYVIDNRGIIMAHLLGAVRDGTLDDVLEQITDGQQISDRNDQYQEP